MKTMKKTAFSVCAAALLLFSACSKDDDKDASEMSSAEISSMIVGTWQIIQEEWSGKYDGEKYSDVYKYAEGEWTLTFNSDHSCIDREWDRESDETVEYTGSWLIEGNTLILDEGAFVIEKLTKDELIINAYEDYGNGDYDKDRIIAKKIK